MGKRLMDVVWMWLPYTHAKQRGTGQERKSARETVSGRAKFAAKCLTLPLGRCQVGIIITSCVHMGSTTHWKFGNMARVAHCVDHLKTVQPVLVFCAGSAAQARVSFALLG